MLLARIRLQKYQKNSVKSRCCDDCVFVMHSKWFILHCGFELNKGWKDPQNKFNFWFNCHGKNPFRCFKKFSIIYSLTCHYWLGFAALQDIFQKTSWTTLMKKYRIDEMLLWPLLWHLLWPLLWPLLLANFPSNSRVLWNFLPITLSLVIPSTQHELTRYMKISCKLWTCTGNGFVVHHF